MTRSNKTRTTKTKYMSDEAFADLKQAVEDALAFEYEERHDLQLTRIQARPKDRMEASQGINGESKRRKQSIRNNG